MFYGLDSTQIVLPNVGKYRIVVPHRPPGLFISKIII